MTQAMVEAVRVKFVDMALDSLESPPQIDERMAFAVIAVCVGSGTKRMRDGELRRVVDMRVLSLTPTSGPSKPAGEPSEPALFDGDGEGEGEG